MNFVNINEGPTFLPLFFSVVIFCIIKLTVSSEAKQKINHSNSLLPQEWKSKFYAPVLIISVLLLFAFSSALIDQVTSTGLLFFFAIACWSLLALVIYGYYDLTCTIAKKYDVKLRTGIGGLDALIGFLVGERIVTALQFALGGLGFFLAVSITIGGSTAWIAFKTYNNSESLKALHKPKQPLLNWIRNNYQSLIAASLIIGYLTWTAFYNFHRPMSAWDNYTQWLIVPYEIITNNAMIGFYDITRSVAPAYPPHQSVSSAFLLLLWGDSNVSENILNIYNPILLCLGLWALFNYHAKQGLGLLGCALVVISILLITNLPVTFRLSGYVDTRSVVALLAIAMVLSLENDFKPNGLGIKLGIITTVAFTCKPYIWPFALLPIVFFVINNWVWKEAIKFFIIVLFAVFIDIYLIQSLAPQLQILEAGGVASRLAETISSILTPDFTSIKDGLNVHSKNIPVLKIFSTFSVLMLVFGVWSWKNKKQRNSFLASAIIIIGLILLLLLVLNQNSGFGNSFSRYLLNASGVLVFGVSVLFATISKKTNKAHTGIAFLGLASLMLVWKLPSSPQYIETNWYKTRLSSLSPFPRQAVIYTEHIKSVTEKVPIDDELVKVAIHPHNNNIDQYKINYLLTRLAPNFILKAQTAGKGPIAGLLEAKSIDDINKFFTSSDIGVLIFREDVEILGITIKADIYTPFEFANALSQASNPMQ